MATEARSIVNSALWAAYGDSLGFPSELVDLDGLKRRIKADRIVGLSEWSRKVGGRFGPTIKLPKGCYSDDTQLRLATSRSIQRNGYFDVESFAKIELPVWLSYALGGGVGTKLAAQNLAHASVTWFSNFYSGKSGNYIQSGGNGAAMRIQPHVWAAKNRSAPVEYLQDVIRNSICTHGNLHGILGAVFHSVALAHTLEFGEVPGPQIWKDCISSFELVPELIAQDRELSSFWLPVWEQRSAKMLSDGINEVIAEFRDDLAVATNISVQDEDTYREVLGSIGGLSPVSRGSGIKTALAASALAWGYRTRPPTDALLLAANLLGSDTDTIATMAGALLGCLSDGIPENMPSDSEYITEEAHRLFLISSGLAARYFQYPEVAMWSPPKSQVAAVGKHLDRLALVGLGLAEPVTDIIGNDRADQTHWQWLRLDFGQTVLAKIKMNLVEIHEKSMSAQYLDPRVLDSNQSELFQGEAVAKASTKALKPSLDELTQEAMRGGLDPGTIGRHILALSAEENGIELCIAYVAIISKTRKARLGKI